MSNKTEKALPEEIAFILGSAVASRKDELIYLLQRNGVNMPNNATEKQLIAAIYAANEKSERFRKELSTVLTQVVLEDADGYTKMIVRQILANATVKFYLYPADNINLARGLNGAPVSRAYGNPGIVREQVKVVGNDAVSARLG